MTAGEYLNLTWDMLVGRFQGPFTFRLLMQPAMAAIFAVRAGFRDAREGRTPYLWAALVNPLERRNLIRQGWKDVKRIFILAIVLDVIYELIVYHRVYVVQALIVSTFLAIVPYLLIRGPITRIIRRIQTP